MRTLKQCTTMTLFCTSSLAILMHCRELSISNVFFCIPNNWNNNYRIAELTRQELLKRHNPRVANAVVDVNPLGSAGLGENSPHWARKYSVWMYCTIMLCFDIIDPLELCHPCCVAPILYFARCTLFLSLTVCPCAHPLCVCLFLFR